MENLKYNTTGRVPIVDEAPVLYTTPLPGGAVEEKSFFTKVKDFIMNNKMILIGLAGAGLVYYLFFGSSKKSNKIK